MRTDDFFLRRMKDLSDTAWKRDLVTYTDFLNLDEQNILTCHRKEFPGVEMDSFGGYPSAERQMIAFHPDALVFTPQYPLDCLKISPVSQKYGEELTHRDYLGAILNLGVDRAVVGDILVREKQAWIFVHRRMTGFFLEEFNRVRHTVIIPSLVEDPADLPQPNFEEIRGTCASPRLDALIALAFKESRSSMVSCIEKGLVYVNARQITSNGYEPKEGDIISVRGKGRFVFDGVGHETRKGRKSVTLRRYV